MSYLTNLGGATHDVDDQLVPELLKSGLRPATDAEIAAHRKTSAELALLRSAQADTETAVLSEAVLPEIESPPASTDTERSANARPREV